MEFVSTPEYKYIVLLCSHHYSMVVRHGHFTAVTSRNWIIHTCIVYAAYPAPNGRIEYQTPLSLSSVTSPASSRCCSELDFVSVAMSLACQMNVVPSACYTANFQMPKVIQVVSGTDIKTSSVSVSEPVKLTIQNGKNWQQTDPTVGTCATTQRTSLKSGLLTVQRIVVQ